MIASMLLVSLLSVVNPQPEEIPEHHHQIDFNFTRLQGTCNWTWELRINGGEWEDQQHFPAQITCEPLNQILKELKNEI